jgi:predicted nucleic acid-binding protein
MAKKKIILCDTNIIIEYLKDNPGVVEKLDSIGKDSIYISSITVGELYFGALNKAELNQIHKKINSLVHIPIIEPISDIFEDLMLKYSLSHKLAIPDAIIAATALYFDIEIFTYNLKDFRFIKSLRLFQ